MIARLRGRFVDRDGGAIVIECGGVGYEVNVSGYTNQRLGELGTDVTLRIFTHAQENKIALFGFATAEERALFDLLITVKNVGPSSAIRILSAGADPHDIARMISGEKVAMLQGIKGIGKKTAEMLVVELRDRCEALLLSWGAAGAELPPARVGDMADRDPRLVDVSEALVQLGWRSAEVDKVLAAMEVPDGATIESLLRQALRAMPR